MGLTLTFSNQFAYELSFSLVGGLISPTTYAVLVGQNRFRLFGAQEIRELEVMFLQSCFFLLLTALFLM